MGQMNTLYIIVLVIAGLFLLPRALKVAAALGLLALCSVAFILISLGIIVRSIFVRRKPKPMTPSEARAAFAIREHLKRLRR